MEEFKNQSESFFREVRSIEIYRALDVSYINAFNGVFPDPIKVLYVFHLLPETLSRSILSKRRLGNDFTAVDINFPLLDLSSDNIKKCEEYFNRKGFAIIEVTNVDKILYGNSRESLKIDFIDNRLNNNSGDDEYTIAISGETIIKPKITNL
ncbi:hypothetical protein [Chryseobacterium mulctrae]|uniref:hypothetical protein n=1 Tax=Chryseobacterium mulctrae TaxID=2576777 RepID=UPI001116B489|nr:hypothetical protein [Chryseobacterium mulctrae]